jgi:hypothetical protein
MKRYAILWVLASVRLGFAADLYVDAARADNSGDGTTPATAEKEIAAALADCTGAGPYTIHVAPGTYPETTTSGRLTFGTTQHGKTITIIRDAAAFSVADAAATFASTNSAAVYHDANCYAGTFIWDGIDVSSSSATTTGSLFNLSDSAAQTVSWSWTIQNCTLAYDATTYGMIYLEACTNATTRDLTLDSVHFDSDDAATSSWVRNNDVDKLIVRDCTGTHGSTAPGLSLFNLGVNAGAALGSAEITGCHFTSTFAPASTMAMFTADTIVAGDILIRGNTLEGESNIINFPAVASGAQNIWIDNNRIILTGSASRAYWAVAVGDDTETSTDTVGTVLVTRNTIDVAGSDQDETTGIMLMRGVSRGLVEANKIDGQQTNGVEAISSIGIYVRCDGVTFLRNSVASSDALIFGYSRGNVALYNSLWDGWPGATRAPLIFRDGSDPARQPLANIVMHNVIQTAADEPVNFSSHTATMTVSSNVVAHNLIWNGTASSDVLAIDGTTYTLAEALSTYWPTKTGLSQWNDIGTVEGDPQFMAPQAGDLRVRSASPARGTRSLVDPDLTSWNDLGAWQTRTPSQSRR